MLYPGALLILCLVLNERALHLLEGNVGLWVIDVCRGSPSGQTPLST